ncbi:uncharacterized protein L203_101426 [Cryptococcus depauperatus CBS 7841]|uniref:Uncharacterized protein n=1 Tax=Cryptococcus depauperatus CBS 7841 TaxID=1295531 RepID=A0A1E3ITP5_9TREE|nr:hypothetical protein L203_01214 [Cryptococcus depauperatus CBS 7841]ODN94440.1 hypothetical protein L204_04572 [Cryptococcus depauperatus CBS 7855]
MYIPFQNALAAGLAFTGALTSSKVVSSGTVLDYAVEKCIDGDGNQRCTKPFAVTKSTCYEIKWSTEGKISHTTAEVRDAGSDEIVYYRDTDGQWTSEKNELVYVDFKPKVWGQGNNTVEYEISTCQ